MMLCDEIDEIRVFWRVRFLGGVKDKMVATS